MNKRSIIICTFTPSNYIINRNITQNIQKVKKKLHLELQAVLLVEDFLVHNSKNKISQSCCFCVEIIQKHVKRKHFPEKSRNTEKNFKKSKLQRNLKNHFQRYLKNFPRNFKNYICDVFRHFSNSTLKGEALPFFLLYHTLIWQKITQKTKQSTLK